MKKRIISAVLSAAMLGTSVFSVPFVSAETTNNEQIEKLLESFIEQNYKGDARVYEENDFVHVEFRKTSANEPYFDTTAISEDFDQFFKENNIDFSLVVIEFLEGTSIIYNAEKLGDINLNGTIDVTDLTELSLYLLGDRELTENQQKSADVDSDGAVTLADLARLQQYLSKKITSF